MAKVIEAETPSTIAYGELVAALQPVLFDVDQCQTEAQLRQLWEIDCEAYGDHSLPFEPFLAWWQRYPCCQSLFVDGKIVASIGIYPLCSQQAADFVTGKIREAELEPVTLAECEASGVADWYFSGLVVVPAMQGTGILRRLIRQAIGIWMTSGHLKYPLNLYGLGQTAKGKKALEALGLSLSVEASKLPDCLDLYHRVVDSPDHLKQHIPG